MKKILFLCFSLIAISFARADLRVAVSSDGTKATLTLTSSGDLSKEFSSSSSSWGVYTPSEKIKKAQNATTIEIITENGARVTSDDMKRLCGDNGISSCFPQTITLDMTKAQMQNDEDLKQLSFMSSLRTITLPKSSTKIPSACFRDNGSKIEHVIIPDNISRDLAIENQAFATSSLKSIVFGQVKSGSIDCQAFLNCNALASVDFHYGWTKIDTQAFMNCVALKTVVLPEGLTEIGTGAFSGSAIETIRLPNSLKTIKGQAFRCHYLKTITIPANVECIEQETFQENYALTDVYLLGDNIKCMDHAFQPNNTYAYTYSGPGCGEEVQRDAIKNKDSKYVKPTVLHYPKSAYEKYVNQHIKNLKNETTQEWEKKFVRHNGNIWPVQDFGKFNNNHGEYAGWNNFMLTMEQADSSIWKDEVRVEDKWYTLCFPFNMTREQIESAYGASCEVVEFSGVKKNSDGAIVLEFKTNVTETKAHHPYMIHPGIRTGTSQGIGTYSTITGIVKQEEKAESLQEVSFSLDGVKYTFKGTYQERTFPAPCYYYHSGNDQFGAGFYKRIKEGGRWTKYTACVLMSKDNGAGKRAGIMFPSKEQQAPTAIAEIFPNTERNQEGDVCADIVFDINGQVVRQGCSDLEGLPEGVYVVNGKKYFVR